MQYASQADQNIITFIFIIAIFLLMFFFKQIHFRKSLFQEKTSFHKHSFFLMMLLVGVVFTLGTIVTNRMVHNEEEKLKAEAMLSISALKEAVEGRIGQIDAGVEAISGSPSIVSYFIDSSVMNNEKQNSELERYRKVFGAYAVSLLDTNGITIASSCYENCSNTIGKDNSFKPYFLRAKSGDKSRYFSFEKNNMKKGYFSSVAVKDTQDKVLGIVVMKYSMDQIENIFATFPNAFLIDNKGTMFTELQDEENKSSSHFGISFFDSVTGKPVNGGRYRILCLDSRVDLSVPGWSIMACSSRETVFRYRITGISVTLFLILCTFFVVNFIALNRVKQWAESIFLSEKLFQTIFENAPESIVIYERSTGLVLSANALAIQKFKIDVNSVYISTLFKRNESSENNLKFPLTSCSLNGLFCNSNGEENCYFSASSAQIWFKGKDCCVSFLRDISEMIKTQSALEESEKRYRELTEFLPEAVFEINSEGSLCFANKRAFEMFGYEPRDLLKNIKPTDMIRPEEREYALANISRVVGMSVKAHYEYTALHKSGRNFPVMIHSTPIIRNNKITGMCGICIDLTDRIRFEDEILKKDKLEALGILAGGIAHDFNNLLTAVWAGLSLIKIKSKSEEQNEIINDMENALRRGKDLTGQLLTYSKGGAPIKEVTSLELLIKETAAFTISGTQVKCDISSQEDLYSVEVDSTQISQVIQNLLINAIESMSDGGIIKVMIRNVDNPLVENIEIPSGQYVEMIITDTGSGIPVETQQHIFDPFFTTKKNGSGLGLATSYSIVKKHNGQIYFDSSVNNGTSFHVLIPATMKSVVIKKKDEKDVISFVSSGRVLLMDDESMILTVTRHLLTHLGYQVETVFNGDAAIESYKKAMSESIRFDVLILDLTVPAGMGGKETMAKLIEIDPDVKALVSSGYSNDPIMADYKNYGFSGFISKPYNVKELCDALNKVLDNKGDDHTSV